MSTGNYLHSLEAIRPVLLNQDLLRYITSFNTDDTTVFIDRDNWLGLKQRLTSTIPIIFQQIKPDHVHKLIKHGNLDMFINIYMAGKPRYISQSLIISAASYGYLDIIRWLYVNNFSNITETAIEHAIKNGHSKIVYWLCINYRDQNKITQFIRNLMKAAAKYGMLEVLQWMYDRYKISDIPDIMEIQLIIG